MAERGVLPTVVAANEWVSPKPKPAALSELADAVLDPGGRAQPCRHGAAAPRPAPLPARTTGPRGASSPTTSTTCSPGRPRSTEPASPSKDRPGPARRSAEHDRSTRSSPRASASASPPSATTPSTTCSKQSSSCSASGASRTGCRRYRRSARAGPGSLPDVTYASDNQAAAKASFNLVAGTTWLFSGPDMATQPVDVLVVDEAGQLSLADTLAACRSARNLLLLGDPLQLPQVAQASHPGGSGGSALQHLLGDADDHAAGPRRVPYRDATHAPRRLHVHLRQHLRGSPHAATSSCAVQSTEFGTGLRWLRAEHEGRSTYAAEEVELVHAEIRRLLGTKWVNQHGEASPLTVRDFLVVAPYNDQVDLLRERLEADPLTRGVAVGSVDKFQGRQAAVVFFSMATSGAEHMPRGADFLFSRNRLNVAISRARCLAYLVCTEELLDSRGRDVEEMRLISTLCAFAASAVRSA